MKKKPAKKPVKKPVKKPAKRKLVSYRRDQRKQSGGKPAGGTPASGRRELDESGLIVFTRGASARGSHADDNPDIIAHSRGRDAGGPDIIARSTGGGAEGPDIIAHTKRKPTDGASGDADYTEAEPPTDDPDAAADADDDRDWGDYERGDDSPEDIKRELLKITASLLFLAVLSYVMATLIIGYPPGFPNLFGERVVDADADEYYFDVGRGRGFADLGGHLAAAGTLGIQVFDAQGNETLRDALRMDAPAIRAQSGRAIVFDIGGSAVRVFDSVQVLAALETEDRLVSASINRNGWFCVCEQASGGYKGNVLVYNEQGRNVYVASIASGYVLSAELSRDNRYLAILTVSDDGGRVIFYSLSGEDPIGTYLLPDAMILDIRFTQRGDLLAVTPQELLRIGRDGSGSTLYAFDGARLGGYALDGGFLAIHLLDYGVGYRGRLVTLDADGRLLREYASDKEIVAMSVGAGELAVLRSDGPVLYSAGSDEMPLYGQSAATTGLSGIVALGGGAALAAGDNSALVFRR
jgi:hypothetical protein